VLLASGGGQGGGGGQRRRNPGPHANQLDGRRFRSGSPILWNLGVDLAPDSGKNVFLERPAKYVNGSRHPQELDVIEAANGALSQTPPKVTINAKFAEVAQNDQNAANSDWYWGTS